MPALDQFDAADVALDHIVFIGNSIDSIIKAFPAKPVTPSFTGNPVIMELI